MLPPSTPLGGVKFNIYVRGSFLEAHFTLNTLRSGFLEGYFTKHTHLGTNCRGDVLQTTPLWEPLPGGSKCNVYIKRLISKGIGLQNTHLKCFQKSVLQIPARSHLYARMCIKLPCLCT